MLTSEGFWLVVADGWGREQDEEWDLSDLGKGEIMEMVISSHGDSNSQPI